MPNVADFWPTIALFYVLPCGAIIAGSILLFLILKFYNIENIELPGGFKFNRRHAKPTEPKLQSTGGPETRPDASSLAAAGPTTTIGGDVHGQVISGDVNIEQKFIQEAPPKEPPILAAAPTPRTARFIDRGPIMALVRQALRRRTATAMVGVGGMGGVGKTELALFLSKEYMDVLWMDVGSRSLGQVQSGLAAALGATLPPNADADGRAASLRAAFEQNPRTVIFDDVRPGFDFQKCLPPSPPCAVLITSRLRQLPGVRPQDIHLLDVMDEAQARALLSAEGLQVALEQEPEAGKQLAKLCGHHPLALSLAAARWHLRPTPLAHFNAALTDRLTQLGTPTDPNDPHANLRANFDLSYEALTPDDRRRFRALAVFAETGFAPDAARAVWGDPPPDADAALTRLLTVSLLRRLPALAPAPAERFAMHDLLRDYALEKLREAKEDEAAFRTLAR